MGVGKSYPIKIYNKINLYGGADETCCNRSLIGSFSNSSRAGKWGDKREMGGGDAVFTNLGPERFCLMVHPENRFRVRF